MMLYLVVIAMQAEVENNDVLAQTLLGQWRSYKVQRSRRRTADHKNSIELNGRAQYVIASVRVRKVSTDWTCWYHAQQIQTRLYRLPFASKRNISAKISSWCHKDDDTIEVSSSATSTTQSCSNKEKPLCAQGSKHVFGSWFVVQPTRTDRKSRRCQRRQHIF